MRPLQAVLLALLTGWLAGCLPARSESGGMLSVSRRPVVGNANGDVVHLDIAVIERPVGDRYLNRALWDLADEQVIGLERKPAVEDNGFRVGTIGGMLPSDLLALLTSERSCINPHRVRLRAGNSTPVVVGPTWRQCRFELRPEGRVTPVELDNAVCTFDVVPRLSDEGKIALRFTPVIKHGETRLEPRAIRDPSGEHRWDLRAEQPAETYAALSWEVAITPGEFLVIGTRLDGPDTIGHRYFLHTETTARIQRMLVLRAGRSLEEVPSAEIGSRNAAPLALQAGWQSARSCAP